MSLLNQVGMGDSNPGFSALTAQERAIRSVFVGNIPYDATEEILKDIFSQAGPVVSFRLVYDRETGKPKGYGFCEYQDIETAQSAMRNLNNYDFNGRPLRVGVAAGEQNRDEIKGMQHALGQAVVESPYGDPVDSDQAPEAISKAVASLPPEQMFELMKQMKLCVQNNPNEARNMLLQNPQLAYALLQAQIVMKIVDPQVALAMLHRDANQVPPVVSSTPSTEPDSQPKNTEANIGLPGSRSVPQMAGGMSGPGGLSMQRLQGPGAGGPRVPGLMDNMISNLGPGPSQDMGGPYGSHDMRDPRSAGDLSMPASRLQQLSQLNLSSGIPNLSSLSATRAGGPQISQQDQEKAALIMQVLQLTDHQIAMLPPEQRQSILVLKEQIAKSV